MRRSLSLLLLLPLLIQAQTTVVTGTFFDINGLPLNGWATVQLSRSSVIDICIARQAVSFKTVRTQILNGALQTLSLLPSVCLVVGQTPSNAIPFAGAGAGTSPTITLNGQISGTLSVTAGTNPIAGTNITGVFTPVLIARIGLFIGGQGSVSCYVLPTNMNSQTISGITYVPAIGLASIGIYASSTALTAGQTYTWNYNCVQPYQVQITDTQNNLIYKAQWSVPNQTAADVVNIDLSELYQVTRLIWELATGTWASYTKSWRSF